IMPHYVRAFVSGGTFFFTVTLLERRGKLMMLKAGCAMLSRPTCSALEILMLKMGLTMINYA
ncbi:MAG: hypothetical protein WCD80_09770, partial [Desulfobaccales bacterium]